MTIVVDWDDKPQINPAGKVEEVKIKYNTVFTENSMVYALPDGGEN